MQQVKNFISNRGLVQKLLRAIDKQINIPKA